jgi:hypothetical protein
MKLSKGVEFLLERQMVRPIPEHKQQDSKESPILSPLLVETVSPPEISVGGEGVETKVVVSYLRQKKLKVKG